LKDVPHALRGEGTQAECGEAADGPIPVHGDEGNWCVLINPLGNAVKFIDHGEVTLKVRRSRGKAERRIQNAENRSEVGASPVRAAREVFSLKTARTE
jgi:signal transduction histidine kinase